MSKSLTVLVIMMFLSRTSIYTQNTHNLKSNLVLLESWNYEQNWDPDSLVEFIGLELVNELRIGQISNIESYPNVSTTSSLDSLIKIYTYSFHSGGTRGLIHNSIIHFRRLDGPNDVILSAVEMNFYQIERLPAIDKELYLLIGSEKSSSNSYYGMLQIIDVSNDTISTQYRAIDNKFSNILFHDDLSQGNSECIACVDYDNELGQLIIDVNGRNDKLFNYSQDKVMTVINKRLYQGLLFDKQSNQFRPSRRL